MSTTTGNKLERVLEKYDLEKLGDELVHRWTRHDIKGESVRELEHRVNFEILKAALRQEGITQDWKITECQMERLTNEKGSVDLDLRERGVDVEEVVEDFVSYQTVHNYLCQTRGVEYQRESPSVGDRVATVSKLKSQMVTVVSSVTENLAESEEIAKQPSEVDVDVGLICDDCETRTDAVRFIRRGGCPRCTI